LNPGPPALDANTLQLGYTLYENTDITVFTFLKHYFLHVSEFVNAEVGF